MPEYMANLQVASEYNGGLAPCGGKRGEAAGGSQGQAQWGGGRPGPEEHLHASVNLGDEGKCSNTVKPDPL